MRDLLIIGSGSFIGGCARYLIGGLFSSYSNSARLPAGTILVNLIGCLLIGIAFSIAENSNFLTQNLRIFIITGLLGGFTTFSAFGFETVSLLRNGRVDLALLNLTISIFGGLLAVYIGMRSLS